MFDNVTKRHEIVDGCAKPGRPNECLAGMNSRFLLEWTPRSSC
jgi:hypothetical protein